MIANNSLLSVLLLIKLHLWVLVETLCRWHGRYIVTLFKAARTEMSLVDNGVLEFSGGLGQGKGKMLADWLQNALGLSLMVSCNQEMTWFPAKTTSSYFVFTQAQRSKYRHSHECILSVGQSDAGCLVPSHFDFSSDPMCIGISSGKEGGDGECNVT